LRVNSSHTYEDRGRDAYWSPPEAVYSLASIEKLPNQILEPACGSGVIAKVLTELGHTVYTSDVYDYGYPGTDVYDYLTANGRKGDFGVVTNPPYRLAEEFVRKAVEESSFVAMLLRLNFLEGIRREKFFAKHPPSRVWVASRRLPMMHRLGWTGKEAPSNQCHAWFVWERGTRDTLVKWFDWKETH
jgi:hypothetical protein